jgi:hypothetical protein
MIIQLLFFAALAQGPTIVGTWRGTSLCTDKKNYPACNDEQAFYEIRATHSADTVNVKAQKIVGGETQLVSQDDFARQPDGTWKTEIRTPRFLVRIVLRVSGDSLTGQLIDVGAAQKTRDIALKRVTKAK